MLQSTSSQEKQLQILIEKLSSQLNVEKKAVLFFINTQLEHAFRNRIQLHNETKLLLDAEFDQLNAKEISLQQEIESKKEEIESKCSELTELNTRFEHACRKLEGKMQEIQKLRTRIENIESDLKMSVKEGKKLSYKLMIKGHELKLKTDKSFNRLNNIMTIVSVIIAIIFLLMWFKKLK